MEDQSPKTGKFALNYGVLLGGISIIFGLMLYFMDMHYRQDTSILIVSLVMMLGVIILGMKQFKKANMGYMSFSQGLKVGLGICLIGGVISMAYQLILSNFIDPEMMNKQLEIARFNMQEMGMSQENIEAQIEMSKKFSGPGMQIAFGLIFAIFIGFLLSLFPALIMKKTESEY